MRLSRLWWQQGKRTEACVAASRSGYRGCDTADSGGEIALELRDKMGLQVVSEQHRARYTRSHP